MRVMKLLMIGLVAVSALALTACTGPEGPMGPAGADGVDGADGSTQKTYIFYVDPLTDSSPYDAAISDIILDSTTPDYTSVVCYMELPGDSEAIALPYIDTSSGEDYSFAIRDGYVRLYYSGLPTTDPFKFVVTVTFP